MKSLFLFLILCILLICSNSFELFHFLSDPLKNLNDFHQLQVQNGDEMNFRFPIDNFQKHEICPRFYLKSERNRTHIPTLIRYSRMWRLFRLYFSPHCNENNNWDNKAKPGCIRPGYWVPSVISKPDEDMNRDQSTQTLYAFSISLLLSLHIFVLLIEIILEISLGMTMMHFVTQEEDLARGPLLSSLGFVFF